MKMLIVIRHGEGEGEGLNGRGRRQMEHLGESLRRSYLPQGVVRVLSSTAIRALESTVVLINKLGIDAFEEHPVLWADSRHRQDNPAVLRLVEEKSSDVDALILMTHLDYAEQLPTLFSRSVLGTEIERKRLANGVARIVFCEEKRAEIIF